MEFKFQDDIRMSQGVQLYIARMAAFDNNKKCTA